jgi:hypothetical protein
MSSQRRAETREGHGVWSIEDTETEEGEEDEEGDD